MTRFAPYVAVALLYVMTPSATELTENLLHLVTEGHTAHAVADDEHERDSPEHGCSGPFHVCLCHHSATFLVAHSPPDLTPPLILADPLSAPAELDADGHATGVFRPPIAVSSRI